MLLVYNIYFLYESISAYIHVIYLSIKKRKFLVHMFITLITFFNSNFNINNKKQY
jgi:hypothetical protein